MPSPYIPNTEADRQAMLAQIGVDSAEALFQDIPPEHRNPALRLPPPLSEMELMAELRDMANTNIVPGDYPCFLGGGSYRHFVPAAVRHILSRGEFFTSYTPYQAEISQGVLQATFEYQSLVCQLTAMEVCNAGMYDGASALAEAVLMACRITGRRLAALLPGVNPRYREVVTTYASGQGIEVLSAGPGPVAEDSVLLRKDCACLVVQCPNFFGLIEDGEPLARRAHDAGVLLVACVDPISLGMLRPPGEWGADIVAAEGHALGSPTSFGGPSLGILAGRMEHLRQLPGRIVGRTTDSRGQTGYVLTLQTREQHIRRERATSNICTNTALMAIAAAAYLAALGRHGLRQVAEMCYHKAHYAAASIAGLPGYSLAFSTPFFKEFVVRCPRPPAEVNRALLEQGIIGGLDVSTQVENGLLLCVTEVNRRREIDRLVAALRSVA